MNTVLGICGAFVKEGRCPGTIVSDGSIGNLIEGECSKCGAAHAIPTIKADAEVRRLVRMQRANLPALFLGQKFEEDDENRDALEQVRSWLESLPPASMWNRDDCPRLEKSPALWGQPGRGKSHLLAAMCVRLINSDLSVLYVATRKLLRDLQRFDADAQSMWDRAVTVPVLALDDIGAEQATEWRHDQLADLVEERYARDRPILIATNWPPSQWDRVMDGRTASRLRGMTFSVELAGHDRRLSPTTQEAA